MITVGCRKFAMMLQKTTGDSTHTYMNFLDMIVDAPIESRADLSSTYPLSKFEHD